MNFLLAGYYGYGNFGDELILSALHQSLGPVASALRVLSSHPRATLHAHGLQAISRWNPWILWRALESSSGLILGGGSLLQSATSRRSLWYYRELIEAARRLRKPIFLWNQGIGPFRSSDDTALVLSLLRNVDQVSIRDFTAYHWLISRGADPHHLTLGADPAWLYQWPQYSREESHARLGWTPYPRPYLGLALKPFGHSDQARSFVTALAKFLPSFPGTLIGLASHPIQDAGVILALFKNLSKKTVFFPLRSAPESCLAIQALDGMFSQRLHPLLIGLRCGLPLLAQSDDPKISGLLAETHMRHAQLSSFDIPAWPDWPRAHPQPECFKTLTSRARQSLEPLRHFMG